jgi:hypothetical protein
LVSMSQWMMLSAVWRMMRSLVLARSCLYADCRLVGMFCALVVLCLVCIMGLLWAE